MVLNLNILSFLHCLRQHPCQAGSLTFGTGQVIGHFLQGPLLGRKHYQGPVGSSWTQ